MRPPHPQTWWSNTHPLGLLPWGLSTNPFWGDASPTPVSQHPPGRVGQLLQEGLSLPKATHVPKGPALGGRAGVRTRTGRDPGEQNYVPTVFERYSLVLQLDGKPVNLSLWDTAGQEDYDRLRPLSYADAQVVLMCYDVMSPNSFDNILSKWYPEVTHFCPGVPIILVGCKTDLRKDKVLLKKLRQDRQEPVTYQKGQSMAKLVRAVAYLECSAWLQDNVPSIFHEAAVAALNNRKHHRKLKTTCKGCVLL
ncbi:rho-related GTP-binding protein RhoD isoform X1 [Sarcophilus harrisii]|uniref:rho-related GTP-binding protein RhoD isoform X1 n=1 Tax=Sarcophilus harrisii TaxID=9305 RepID=UPI000C7B28B9|nr:rho-related GTP-binding protein RhoD isoform X1 [Sarcophilus harrisii]